MRLPSDDRGGAREDLTSCAVESRGELALDGEREGLRGNSDLSLSLIPGFLALA